MAECVVCRLLRCRQGPEVEYSLGLIPLGGFVEFPNGVDDPSGCARPIPLCPLPLTLHMP